MTTPKVDVLLVGAGVASMATVIRLFQFSNKPLSIAIVEKEPELRYGGLAYAAKGNSWSHIFNIQAGRMSIFREDVEDFLNWINKEADRSHWPAKWKNMIFHVSGPAPRRAYSEYIKDRFESALKESLSGSSVIEIDSEVINIEKKDKQFIANLLPSNTSNISQTKIIANHVIIGTGNLLSHFPFTKNIENHPSFIRRQYMPEGIKALESIPKKADVAIIGSSLSAYDSIISLREDLKHLGKITLFSRTGLTPFTYPQDHQHQVIAVRKPPFLDTPYQGKKQLIKDITNEWNYLNKTIKTEFPDIHTSVIPERITKAWETYLPELIERMPAEDSSYLLDKYNSVIATMRVAAMPLAANFVKPLKQHNVELIEAEILSTTAVDNSHIEITFLNKENGSEQKCVFQALISNLNRETNYSLIQQPLWRNLMDVSGLATIQTPTHRGVAVTELGELINQQGDATLGLFAVGIPREGDEISRNGRQGAFAYNVATIKNHSISVALKIVSEMNRLDLSVTQVLSTESKILLKQAANMRINWLSQRTRAGKRVVLSAMLENIELLALSIKEDGSILEHARTVAASLTEALTLKMMTDISVTPKQLREKLGLTSIKIKRRA